MKSSTVSIRFESVIERIAPEVPRFIVYSGKAWDETGTVIVDVSLNGIPIGLRNLIPWPERGWHVGLSESICRKVGVHTGDRVQVEIYRLGDALPKELQDLLKSHAKAEQRWSELPKAEQRDFVLFVANAKRSRQSRSGPGLAGTKESYLTSPALVICPRN